MWLPLQAQHRLEMKVAATTVPPQMKASYEPLSSITEEHMAEFALSVKADDAAVPVHFWNDRLWEGTQHCSKKRARFETTYKACPLDSLRSFFLRIWRRRVLFSLLRYLRETHGTLWAQESSAARDIEVGVECLFRCCGADWWEWKGGSTLFFWRWPKHLHIAAREGYPVWWLSPPPNKKQPQMFEKDPVIRNKVIEKLSNIRLKRYIKPGDVQNLTNYFAVPKGDSDIRMVYDASKSGLNDCIWVPSFTLPGAEALVDVMDSHSVMMDLDLGEMFLNFPMHPSIQPFCGLDLRPYLDPTSHKTMWERWCRCMMGWKASPYLAGKYQLLADEIIQGDKSSPSNPFQWEQVILNLPGTQRYDPTQPWVYRIDKAGHKRCGGPTYVDDVRMVGFSKTACWAVAHRFATILAYLGIQVAARKTRPPSQTPGAWAGIVAIASKEGIYVSVTQDKWDKARGLLQELNQELETQGVLNHKALEKKRGFFNHLQRTYPAITPFLKGFHLTLDGWREHRDEEMWKICGAARSDTLDLDDGSRIASAPTLVSPAPRLREDLGVLIKMFASATPAIRSARSTKVAVALYGFGDASSAGFGASVLLPNNSIYVRYGMWGIDTDGQSSNYRELRNLVETVEAGITSGDLLNAELFLFTDNTTAEGAYYRGNSDNKLLFELVVRLRCLDMSANIRVHLIHIAGTRMIAQGTDAISRGQLMEGLALGPNLSSFVPLHLPAHERSDTLLPWVQSWTPDPQVCPLTPEEWYTRGHGWITGTCNGDNIWMPVELSESWILWSPAPAAAQAAVNELNLSRHKRSHLNHIFLCPRLCTHLWRKRLFKVSDLVIEVPAGSRPFWPAEMHEPLLIGLTLRFSSKPPWQLRNSPSVLALGRALHEMWADVSGDERHLLRQLCMLPTTMDSL